MSSEGCHKQCLQEAEMCLPEIEIIEGSYLTMPATPVSECALSKQQFPNAADIALRQIFTLPVLSLSFAGARKYIYTNCLPHFAVLIMSLLSVEYFWLSDKILYASEPMPLCRQLARRIYQPREMILAAAITLLAASACGSLLYTIADVSLEYLVGTNTRYKMDMQSISAFTGFVGGGCTLLCPSWRAATSLLLYCGAFILQSVDIIAYRDEALRHSFIIDNGELMAQIGAVITVIILFKPNTPREVFTHIAQHVSGLIHIYGSCTAIAGFIGCLKRGQALSIFQGVICVAWFANIGAFLWYRYGSTKFKISWDRKLMPCTGDSSPSLLGVVIGGVGGIVGMVLASQLYFAIPGTLLVKCIYAFFSVVLAKCCKGWWVLIKHRAQLSSSSWRCIVSDCVLVLLPLSLCFYPYYRIDNPNEFLLPRSVIIAMHDTDE